MDREAGWWTTSRNIGLPPLVRVMRVGRQQQATKDITLLTEEMQAANEYTNKYLIQLTEYQHKLTITEQCVNGITTELKTLEQTHLHNINV